MPDDQNVLRSRVFSDFIKRYTDATQKKVIEQYHKELEFEPIGKLMIGPAAWDRVREIGVFPKFVFAHPDILQAHPRTSLYYRGIALLSRKRVAQAAASVTDWEKGLRKAPIYKGNAVAVARLYNTVISSIIEGSTDWTLDNGHRNILAAMGISLDGEFRNKIGDMAEALVKGRIVDWLRHKGLIPPDEPDDGVYLMPQGASMRFGSEPDIAFTRDGRLVATIEIKGGTDPAGALERLGAMAKSFAETPPACVNFLVAGVVTPEMRSRLDEIGVVKVYLLDDLSEDGDHWDGFTQEVFHHAVRVI